MNLRSRQKSKNGLIGVLIALIVLTVVGIVYVGYLRFVALPTMAQPQLENIDARVVPVAKKVFSFAKAENKADEFSFSINQRITAKSGQSADFEIVNPQQNRYIMAVEIALSSSGEVVFRSGLIPPGYAIASAGFDWQIPVGSHEAIAYFYAIDADDQALLGILEQPVSITNKE